MSNAGVPPSPNALTSLKQALVDELRTQRRLKAEVLQELGGGQRSWTDILKHPAILLVIGAVSTGLIGQYLTTGWQRQEWTRQQAQIQAQKVSEIRHALINELAQALAETIAACHDVLALATWQWSPDRQALESQKRLDYWLETSRKWRVNARVLEQKLRIYYSAEAVAAFQTIADSRRVIGVDITNLIAATNTTKRRAAPPKDEAKPTLLERVNQLDDLLSKLTAIMMHEARQTDPVGVANGQPPAATTTVPSPAAK